MIYLCKTLVYRNRIHVRWFTIYALNKSNISLIKPNTIPINLNDFFTLAEPCIYCVMDLGFTQIATQ